MPNKKTSKTCCEMDGIVELFQLQLYDSEIRELLENGKETNEILSELEGYIGMDYLLTQTNHIIILLRWKNDLLFEQSLPKLMSSLPIKQWFGKAQHIEHQPTLLKSYRTPLINS